MLEITNIIYQNEHLVIGFSDNKTSDDELIIEYDCVSETGYGSGIYFQIFVEQSEFDAIVIKWLNYRLGNH